MPYYKCAECGAITHSETETRCRACGGDAVRVIRKKKKARRLSVWEWIKGLLFIVGLFVLAPSAEATESIPMLLAAVGMIGAAAI